MTRYCCFATFLLLSTFVLQAQIVRFDSLDKNALAQYDVFFLGEQHGYNGSDTIELKLVEYLYGPSAKLLMEGPYDRNFAFDKIYQENDTVNYPFELFNPSKTRLFRGLYSKQIPVKLIDVFVFRNSYKFTFEEFLSKKITAPELQDDLLFFHNTGTISFPHKKRDRQRYLSFVEAYKEKKMVYASSLGADSTKADECFLSIEASILSGSTRGKHLPAIDNIREAFMSDLIAKELNDTAISKLIIINGWGHLLPEKRLPKLGYPHNWKSVSQRIQTSFPEKKVCTILLWNRKERSGTPFFFWDDCYYILNHTRKEYMYLITLDYPGSPFTTLKSHFTHVLVY